VSADLVGTVRREDYDGGYSIWLRARTTAAGEHWVCVHSSAPGNPGMGWGQGWAPIEDHTVIIGAVPGTPAAEALRSGAGALLAAHGSPGEPR